MRRHAAILAAGALSLTLAACGGQETRATTPETTGQAAAATEKAAGTPIDEQEFAEITHEIFEANKLDAVFGRHESVLYRVKSPLYVGQEVLRWQTPERAYVELGPTQAFYREGRMVYERAFDTETQEFLTDCGFTNDQFEDSLYQFSTTEEDEFLDIEHETFVSGTRDADVITIVSHIDEEATKAWYAGNLPLEEAQGTLICECVCDAETFELISNTFIDAASDEVLYRTSASYDEDEPAGSLNLRAAFERESDHTVDVTWVVDAGTDHEWSETVTIPANTEVGFASADPYVFFDDADATTLTHWDYMSDRTIYIFTYPSDEMQETFDRLSAEEAEA